MMNNNTKRKLKKVIAGGLMALILTTYTITNAIASTEPPIVHSAPTTEVNATEPPIVH